ncbi:MAG: hypothetical protein JWS12_56, partial [Candidatus Saccharibacteria bacterium]|nr:hypothetical protein [Candidatus Saccharibacteria bacterium]
NRTSPSTATTQYHYLSAASISVPSSTEGNRQIQMPVAGTLRNLSFTIDTPPGTGANWIIAVRKNGVTTALSVTIQDAEVTKIDTTHSVTFMPNDLIALRITPSSGTVPAAFTLHSWDIECNAPGQIIVGGNSNNPSTAAANFTVMQGGNPITWTGTESNVQIVCPTAGTLTNLFARLNLATGAGSSYTVIVRKGGDTVLSTIIADPATSNSNTTNSVAVVAGDLLSIKVLPSASPAPTARSIWWGLLFTPTVDGESFFGFGNSAVPSTTATNFEQGFYAGANAWNATESAVTGYIGPQTLKKLYVSLVTAPSAGTSRTFTVRKNSADTALAGVVSGTGTTGNIASDVTFARTDTYDISSFRTGAAVAPTGGVHIGVLVYSAPAPRRVIIT